MDYYSNHENYQASCPSRQFQSEKHYNGYQVRSSSTLGVDAEQIVRGPGKSETCRPISGCVCFFFHATPKIKTLSQSHQVSKGANPFQQLSIGSDRQDHARQQHSANGTFKSADVRAPARDCDRSLSAYMDSSTPSDTCAERPRVASTTGCRLQRQNNAQSRKRHVSQGLPAGDDETWSTRDDSKFESVHFHWEISLLFRLVLSPQSQMYPQDCCWPSVPRRA